jgi:hypothetical protein
MATQAEEDAKAAARSTIAFLLAQSRNERPAVPDSVWGGRDSWVLHHSGRGWRLSERGANLMKLLAQRAQEGAK